MSPEILRAPGLAGTALGGYADWLAAERGLSFADYDALWRWSVDEPEAFWASIWDHFGVRAHEPYERVLASATMPGAQWFPGATLNYAEHALVHGDDDALAVVSYSDSRAERRLTFGQLRAEVARARAGLRRLGVGPGDRVAAYLPNIPEALVAFLATASLGAVWASCAPEFGARSVLDRLSQIEPKVLLAVPGYAFGAKDVDKAGDVAAIRAGLPTLRHVVGVPHGRQEVPSGTLTWAALLASEEPLEFLPVPFDHPLYVLYSSGTTGLPKAIVHGHGGILLEHLKLHAFTMDTRPGDRVLWFTTTAWTMWNILVSALVRRATVVLHDGNPQWPDLTAQWRLAARAEATLLGTSPAYLMACRAEGVEPEVPSLRTLGVTGSPLPAEGFDWAAGRLGVAVNSMSGGTDICSAFVAGNPWLPVYRGEIPGPCLGVDVAAFDPDGREVVDELGELVVRAPLPSMPVSFWNDAGGERYRASYFDTYPGVWRHGDWVRFTEHGSCVISGRSDATLNRGGVRLGTAEFYAVVEDLPGIADSLVVHLEDSGGGPGELLLFVALSDGVRLDEALRARIKAALRGQLSPRHVPDVIEVVPAIPRTLTGKKLEAPVKQILRGRPAAEVINTGATTGHGAVATFVDLHRRRAATA
ncbi:acetoacetate--CoA ligase [Amycolatopsis nalaikhensis]|uniref:Acetoacetate--CoA ligase n=1 Tax=Amycolatopsis nalaikhensis TaxID=715472 RepID=A0ABY8XK26_9PSEU|nr:acetoacetate--CoA ligase [Amycolatopsis sp. 2-2]WIV55966.1 acetoacetate--CoA ligase [Amycolatopsis sp. 2-2]